MRAPALARGPGRRYSHPLSLEAPPGAFPLTWTARPTTTCLTDCTATPAALVADGEPTAPTGRFVDLFAGCGGFSLGLMQAGWQGLFAVERDKHAFATLSHNLLSDRRGFTYEWPTWLRREPIEIAHLNRRYWAKLRALRGTVDLLVGGCRAKDIPSAGLRRRDDHRNQLVDRVPQAGPPTSSTRGMVLLENVRLSRSSSVASNGRPRRSAAGDPRRTQSGSAGAWRNSATRSSPRRCARSTAVCRSSVHASSWRACGGMRSRPAGPFLTRSPRAGSSSSSASRSSPPRGYPPTIPSRSARPSPIWRPGGKGDDSRHVRIGRSSSGS